METTVAIEARVVLNYNKMRWKGKMRSKLLSARCVWVHVCVMKYRARTYVYMLYFNAGEYTCINVCVYACIHPATGLGTVCDSIVFVA